MFKLYKLILSWHDWHDPEPGPVDSDAFDGLNTAGWFIVIFCFILFALGERDKYK